MRNVKRFITFHYKIDSIAAVIKAARRLKVYGLFKPHVWFESV